MKTLGIFLVTLAFAPTSFAGLPSIACYNVVNASYSLKIKATNMLPSHIDDGKKVYLSNVTTWSGSHLDSSELNTLAVDAFSSGRLNGYIYSTVLQNGSEVSLSSSCLYGPDICSSPLFTGTIKESSGAVHNLTCKFE